MWCIPVFEHLEQAQYMAGDRKYTLPKGSKKQGTPIHMWCIPVSENFEQAQHMAGDTKCTLLCIPASEHAEQSQYMAGNRQWTLQKGSKKQGAPIHMCCILASEHLD